MKIEMPPDIYGGNPAALLEHFGLRIDGKPTAPDTVWEVSRPFASRAHHVHAAPAPSDRRRPQSLDGR